MASDSKWIWMPDQAGVEETNVYRFMQRLGTPTREAFLAFSVNHPEEFWSALASELNLEWFTPYSQVMDLSGGVEWSRWFAGGRLNIVHNCLDRWQSTDRTAILAEDETGRMHAVPFAQLSRDACRLANHLKSMGVEAGDRIALVMPMMPETVVALYAALKIGAIAVPIFAGFGSRAIETRLADSGARVILTADRLRRRGAWLPLRAKVDEAIARLTPKPAVVMSSHEQGWGDLLDGDASECETLALDSEATSLILYTSGTTGKPKGVVHTHAGALIQTAKEIYLGFDHKPEDRFWWLSDIGWMMGPWMIFGNHAFGGTIFIYDGAPDCPHPDRLWEMIDRHGITTFGVSPTAVRLLMRASDPSKYPMSALRLLGSTGEPWDETSYLWFFENVGRRRLPIINISGGTEIIGSFVFPLPIQPLKPCTVGGPAPGMATEVVDEEGNSIRGRMGYLVCTKPAPSMTRGIWGDPRRYLETYWSRWPGWWNHGGWASIDEDGCWFLHGRADESMNVAGRKVGPAEVEEALIDHAAVSEAAVIGVPDQLKGEAIVGFAVLKAPATAEELSRHLVAALGPTFRPREIRIVTELPKTQSGKIVRRLIRQRYLGEAMGDASTVSNPAALDQFKAG
jgi:acetyl-CoA synthetase